MSVRSVWMTVIAVALVAIIVLTSVFSRQERLVVGVAIPLSGDVSSYGLKVRDALVLAADEINRDGGVLGRELALVFEDTAADPVRGVSAATQLMDVHGCSVIIGAVASSVTLAIAPKTEERGVLLFSPASSSPVITAAGDYVFRNYPSDLLEGAEAAELALERDLKKCAILTINNDYGVGLNKVFEETYIKFGGKVTHNDEFTEDTTIFSSVLDRIEGGAPDAIFIVGYGRQLGTIIRQARDKGMEQQFISTVNFQDSETISAGGATLEGALFTAPTFDAGAHDPAVSSFVVAFEERYQALPDVWHAHGYDALRLVVHAMNISEGTSASAVREGLMAIEGFAGASGVTSFDKNGDVVKSIAIMTVRDGKWAPAE